jgi:EAL domain-containing protein (putative c-di-GMP-specific phosphodiesterase class I)
MSSINIDFHTLKIEQVKEILQEKTYGVEYQPFVSTKTQEVFAYEALARFTYNQRVVNPEEFFEVCHKDLSLFYDAEFSLKKYQFRNRPEDKKLFVNFDPHVFLQKKSINEILHYFSKQKDFVIELVENSSKTLNMTRLINVFKNLHFNFAVDDFLKENSMFCLTLLRGCDYLKLDIDTLKEMKNDEHFLHVIEGLVTYSHKLLKEVILEGVEKKEDFELAKSLHIDYVQGFLFRPLFVKKF